MIDVQTACITTQLLCCIVLSLVRAWFNFIHISCEYIYYCTHISYSWSCSPLGWLDSCLLAGEYIVQYRYGWFYSILEKYQVNNNLIINYRLKGLYSLTAQLNKSHTINDGIRFKCFKIFIWRPSVSSIITSLKSIANNLIVN